MTEEVERCENCEKDIPAAKIATHFGYCRRNIIKCKICGETYDKNFYEEHEEESHATKQCQYCSVKLKKNEVIVHSNNCSFKPKYCQFCDLHVPSKDFDKHLKICQSRTNQCQICGSSIVNKQYQNHIKTCKGKKTSVESTSKVDFEYNFGIEDSLSKFSNKVQKEKRQERGFKKEEKVEKKQNKIPAKKQEIKKQAPLNRNTILQKKKGQSKKEELKNDFNPEQVRNRQFNQNYFQEIGFGDFQEEDSFSYDPLQFQSNFIQPSLHQSFQSKLKMNGFGDLSQEDQLLQQTLLQSSKKRSKKNKNIEKEIPTDFMSEQIMNSSFYGDILDIEKQKAIQEDFMKNQNSRLRKR